METACIKETFTAGDIEPNQPYEPELNLTQFPRALDIADNYQKYRISKVEYIYKPLYDTFQSQYQAGSNVNVTVPYLFSKVLNYPSPNSFGLSYLTTLGAKPRRIDDKSVKVTYTPHILQGGLVNTVAVTGASQGVGTSGGVARAIKKPWLNTHYYDPSGNQVMDNTIHFGHVFWIQQEVTNPDPTKPVCALDVNVYFEFAKPWDKAAQTPDPPQKKNPFNTN